LKLRHPSKAKAGRTSHPPRRRWRIFSSLLLLLLAALVVGDATFELHRPLPVSAPLTFEFASGQGLRSVLAGLGERDVLNVRQRIYLRIYARLSGYAAHLRAGEYAVEPGVDALALWRLILSGKVVLHDIRFVEGWRFQQAWDEVRQNEDLRHTLADPAALMQALGAASLSPEGRFFPDTYHFARGTTDVAVLKLAFDAMNDQLNKNWAERDADLPYANPAEALTLASIIEKESGNAAERPEIAGVFVRRLRIGMRLQADPTVIYGLGDHYDGSIHTVDLRTDTPYNTYTRVGLPPTPICLPGATAIFAALHPAPGTAFYFVSRGDGSHQFSTTLDEQDAAVRRYQIDGMRAPPRPTLPVPAASIAPPRVGGPPP
jgi:UPF0755 protein